MNAHGSAPAKAPKNFFLLVAFSLLFSSAAGAAGTQYPFNKNKDEKDREALDNSFASAFLKKSSSSPRGGVAVVKPALHQSLDELVAARLVEIEQGQELYIHSASVVVKFVSTEEGVVTLDTVSSDVLRAKGRMIGRTFLHVWDAVGRKTFELHVLAPKILPSSAQVAQESAFERSSPFKFRYGNDRSAFYSGDKASEIQRQSLDLTHNFTLEGDTPYGHFSSGTLAQRAGKKTLFTEAHAKLEDGHIGDFKNFDLTAGDSPVAPGLMAFPSAVVRGASMEKWNASKTRQWTGFYGREEASVLGTISPGLLSKRTKDSFLSGNVLDMKFNDSAKMRAGVFTGSGRSRPDELNRAGAGARAELKLAPNVELIPETDFDSERFAHKHGAIVTFEKLTVKAQMRDVSKKFVTLLGSPSERGELGTRFDVNANPTQNVNLSAAFDVFRDRLIPNPEDVERYNVHTDMLLSIMLTPDSSVTFNVQDMDDRGRLGPTEQTTFGAQFNQRVKMFGRRSTFYLRGQNRDSQALTNPLSNYTQDQLIAGLYTELFWGVNFSLQNEWNFLDEPNAVLASSTPHALVYTFDWAHELWDTPFYLDLRLRHRDEEQTESTNSFMSGEDSTELSGALHYREFENLDLYISGSIEQFRPENLALSEPRVEAQFMAGMRYEFDTGVRWNPIGSFEGTVFKDLNGDGVRQTEEPGIEGMVVTASGGKVATTGKDGHYLIRSVSGKNAALTLDSSKFPYGFTPTSSLRLELPIVHGQTQRADFGLTPRSQVGGLLFNDLNFNGKFEPGEPGVRKVKLDLDGKPSARTNGQGVYTFSDVLAGEHEVSIDLLTLPDGYLPLDVPRRSFTLFEGIRYEINFPLRAKRTLAGRVFLDANANGAADKGEKGIAGVTVFLGGEPAATDEDGYYLYDNLPSGSYELRLSQEGLPEGSVPPPPTEIQLPIEPVTVADRDFAVRL